MSASFPSDSLHFPDGQIALPVAKVAANCGCHWVVSSSDIVLVILSHKKTWMMTVGALRNCAGAKSNKQTIPIHT